MKQVERLLEIDGKFIPLLKRDGDWYVALRPLLNILQVDSDHYIRTVKTDKILGQHLRTYTGVAADNKQREMACLPEKYIYGFLFQINSDSEALVNYKQECYDVLYNHFHGRMMERMNVLSEKIANIEQIQELKASSVAEEIRILENRNKKLDRMLKGLDEDLLIGQISFDLKTE